jgi:excinuclease UvrABC nuclease subunit
LLRTLEDIEERQRIAAAQGDDTDVLAYHAEPPLVAANLFHLRGGFWPATKNAAFNMGVAQAFGV